MPAIGDRVDTYLIEQALGEGGFSRTYLARDDQTGNRVVLKWPNEALLGDQTVMERWRRELAITRRLSHANIQCAVDSGGSRSAPYLALAYVEGVSLHTYLQQQVRLPLAQVLSFAQQLAAALDYLHGRRIYHRDLKPANVLIGAAGRVTIIDFGNALMPGARRMTWQSLTNAAGTPGYMSPEQIQGNRGDARSDIYALGTILYELLAGRPAFGRSGDDFQNVMELQLRSVPPPLDDDVPLGLRLIVRKCLRRDPAERYQSVAEFCSQLEQYHRLTEVEFAFADEDPQRLPNAERRLLLLGASMTGTFIAVVAVVLGVVLLVEQFRWWSRL